VLSNHVSIDNGKQSLMTSARHHAFYVGGIRRAVMHWDWARVHSMVTIRCWGTFPTELLFNFCG
jgi:hypothetical protein